MAILKESPHQSAHWYTRDGKAMHTVPNADGDGTRPTHLGDARKLGLFPSVSAILQVLDKPGLDKWKREQVALAAMRLTRQKKESDDYYMERIIAESNQKVKKAQDHGIGVHGEMERYIDSRLKKTDFAPNAKTFVYTEPAIRYIEAKGIVPVANEVVLVNHEHGFGGTSDLPCLLNSKTPALFDYKTKETKPGEPIEPYPEQAMQIAAYAATYWKEQFARCWGLNLYLSSTEPGRTEAAAYSPAQLAAEWEVFKMLCAIWRHLNQYDPRFTVAAPAVFHQPKLIVVAGPGGKLVEDAVVRTEKPAAPALPVPPPVLPVPPSLPVPPGGKAESPAVTGKTMLEVIETAVLTQPECDGIKFLSPRDCASMPSGKTDYAWWWHAETQTARVSIRGDGAMREHGWRSAFLAYPADVRVEAAAPKPAPVVKKDDPLPLTEGKKLKDKAAPRPLDKTAEKMRIKEIEAMPITFGKFKGHAKTKTIGDLPASYLDYLRDVQNVPPHIKEYLSFASVIKAIEKELK